jgi:hypothetical protein
MSFTFLRASGGENELPAGELSQFTGKIARKKGSSLSKKEVAFYIIPILCCVFTTDQYQARHSKLRPASK